jgi:hypothetical protein
LPSTFHAEENSYSRQIAKEARTGKSKDPTKPITKNIDCSLFLYQDGTLWEKKILFCCKQLVNLTPTCMNHSAQKYGSCFPNHPFSNQN